MGLEQASRSSHIGLCKLWRSKHFQGEEHRCSGSTRCIAWPPLSQVEKPTVTLEQEVVPSWGPLPTAQSPRSRGTPQPALPLVRVYFSLVSFRTHRTPHPEYTRTALQTHEGRERRGWPHQDALPGHVSCLTVSLLVPQEPNLPINLDCQSSLRDWSPVALTFLASIGPSFLTPPENACVSRPPNFFLTHSRLAGPHASRLCSLPSPVCPLTSPLPQSHLLCHFQLHHPLMAPCCPNNLGLISANLWSYLS